MLELQLSISIEANRRKVWDTMLQDSTYREWTRAFHASSYYEGSWSPGSEMRFLAPDDKGNLHGMYSKIRECREFNFVSIEHLGLIANGLVDTSSAEAKKWAPSFENYTFNEKDGGTQLLVRLQLPDEFAAMFEKMWKNALGALKMLCEK